MRWILVLLLSTQALAGVDIAAAFKGDDGCFVELDARTGRMIREHNAKRCLARVSPCSTFKFPLAFMAFESKLFSSPADKWQWDQQIHVRAEENKDQTPQTWITNSVVWVSQRVVTLLGEGKVREYLRKFSYGNQDVSGGFTRFWLSSSLKISPHEEAEFLARLFNRDIPVEEPAFTTAKELFANRPLADGSKVYAKTGTCCSDQLCKGPQMGWFVGVVEGSDSLRSFALNFSDRKAQKEPAGYRARERAYQILNGK